jgi:hypothetical protein
MQNRSVRGRSLDSPADQQARGMTEKAFRVEVRKGGQLPTPYRWEIYRGDDRICVERSLHRYPTEQAAREAGMQAMASLIRSNHRRRT